MTILHGAAYPFTARVDGCDLVVENVRATWFGGSDDPGDNGETASGILTRGAPELLGCALPMNGYRATAGSPLPRLPWRTPVDVAHHGKTVRVELIDLGPSPPPRAHAGIDLTVAAFRALAGSLAPGAIMVDYRIIGGARHLPASPA